MGQQQFVEPPPFTTPQNVVTKSAPKAPEPVQATPPKAPESPKPEKVDAPQVTSADILKRSQASEPQKDASVSQETSYREDLEKITDPAVKAVAEKALKDFESGYNKKFQTLAQQRKELDDIKEKFSKWTPERIAQELRNPDFVQAAQTYQQQATPQGWSGSEEEWSALSPNEKEQFRQMRQETQSLQSQMQRMLQSQEDQEIKKLYPDYEPVVVDEAIEGLRTGKITASRADIWKVVNHDKNVEKGYQFGYEDGYKKALEKMNGSSFTAGNPSVAGADDIPDDVRKGGFSSIALWRLSKTKNGTKK